MIPVSEASITDKPAPASTRRTGLVPVSRAWPRRNTAMPARPAPRKAQPRYWPMLARSNSATPTITASAAPALIPSRPGSASGLRVSACISAPATPSAAPASSATRVRGRRSSRTTRWRSSCGSTACRASRVTARGTGREPSARLARAASASSSAPASRPQARRRRRRIGDACMSGLPANGVPSSSRCGRNWGPGRTRAFRGPPTGWPAPGRRGTPARRRRWRRAGTRCRRRWRRAGFPAR